MATVAFVTPEEFHTVKQEVALLKSLLNAYVASHDEWLPTGQALKAAGIKTRETLVKYARASCPNQPEAGRITFQKQGVKCYYLRSSCIDYAQRKLGRSTLLAIA